MRAAELADRLQGATKTREGWQARCPAHEDHTASLSIADGEKGLLIHCFAGCKPEDVAGAMGIKMADLFNGKPERNGKWTIVATYPYTDEQGKVLFEVVRVDPKDFRQRDPAGNWSTKGIRRVPFHLPQLIEAVKSGRPVFVAEGEKDVLALEAAGFAATCNPEGAGKWRAEFSSCFERAEVIIIADKDGPGRKHAAEVWEHLHGTAASVKVIELPDLPGKPVKDAADYFAAGGQAADLDELSRAAQPTTEPKPDPWLELVEDGADMATRELPALIEIVNGILPEQCKLLIGSGSKSWKTWLSLDMALSIAHGKEFLGRATTRCKVLYVNLELRSPTFCRRLQAVAKAKGIKIEREWFRHLPLRGKLSGAILMDVITRLIRMAKQFGATVVFLDPIYKLNQGDENSVRDQTLVFNELDRLTTEAECTVIINDHFSKGNQADKDPLDAIRGSSAKGGDVDAAMVLRRHEVAECFRVDLVHRELPPVDPFVIGWNYPLMELRQDLDPDAMKKAKGGRTLTKDPLELLALIRKTTTQNPISLSAWAALAEMKRPTLVDYAKRMRIKGWIRTVGEGSSARQHITPAGLGELV